MVVYLQIVSARMVVVYKNWIVITVLLKPVAS
jgi:hypothetical protein